MATLVFSGIGTALGGPIGGAIGSLVGRQVDTALFGASTRRGPRLTELAVTTSSYGQILPRHFGRMRTAGTVIWATDLVEHSETQGTGKATPALTSYSYTANFAVALSSRPILGIGRIWADGKLLRGTAGDLKTPGTLRIHTGAGDQHPDPLIAAAEGAHRCPAYRGLAYVVFEDLDLSEYYNRIPSLSFEVIADEDFDLQSIIGDVLDDIDAAVPLDGAVGYTSEGPPAGDLATFAQVMPLDIDASGPEIVIARERRQNAVLLLPEPAVATQDGDFGGTSGFSRSRAAPVGRVPSALRYYDVDRDYQPGVQRATGPQQNGAPEAMDLPAALTAPNARALIERAARRLDWTRDRIAWRTSELNTDVAPGAHVALPGIAGTWRVRAWEWLATGIELSLERAVPTGADTIPLLSADPGRANPPLVVQPGETRVVAFEMPFDPARGPSDKASLCAAVCGTGAGWRGAALYADKGDGQLLPFGPSGRAQAVIGAVRSPLAPASPLLIDRGSQLIVALSDLTQVLVDADPRQRAEGANLALVGEEIIQFLNAAALGEGRWRLSGLLRGRGGTEAAIGSHGEGEPFVLLRSGLVPLDAATLGSDPTRQVLAVGTGDDEPASSSIHLSGLTLRPLTPVHPRRHIDVDGNWTLSWTRRARGGWMWQDGVDVPLVEQDERYLVTLGPLESPVASWTVTAPRLVLDAVTMAALNAQAPAQVLRVRQQGTHALSAPLHLCTLS